ANTLSDGLVSGYRKIPISEVSMIQTTAPISHGSSGGPLLRADGKVVGVTSVNRGDGQNLNFAVPATHVARLLPLCDSGKALTQLPIVREVAERPKPSKPSGLYEFDDEECGKYSKWQLSKYA